MATQERNTNDNSNSNNNNNNNNNIPFLDFTGEQTELLKVQAIPSSEYALKGVKNELHILFQITTLSTTQGDSKRTPCDLAIVLDRSGSMEGDKLTNSKLAIKEVIQNLLPNDKLHLITYDTQIEVVFENADLTNISLLQQQIDQIGSRGCTNLHAGLKKGAEILQKHKTEEARVQRIFLFSDGLANEGPSKPHDIQTLVKEIHQSGTTVSSFGIGADFDESLMKSIAECGSGDYYFIENASVIQSFVDLALKGLLGLVGTNAVLKIRGTNGAVVTKIYAHDDVVKGALLGDIRQNNMRKIVCVVEVSPTLGQEMELVSWALSYIPENQNQRTEIKGSIRTKLTEDDSFVIKKHPAVEVARITQEIGESDLEALGLVEKGKRKEAIEMKKKDLAKLYEAMPMDTSGFVAKLIENNEKLLDDMEKKTDKEVQKEVHYNSYTHQRNDYYMM